MSYLDGITLEHTIGIYEETLKIAHLQVDSLTLGFLKELKAYKDSEEQGLLLRLQVKPGDTIYQPIGKDINDYKVIGLCYNMAEKEWLYELAILTEKEKSILFSAITREEKVCKENGFDDLVKVCQRLLHVFSYNRFEKHIRNKAIDEFAERITLPMTEEDIARIVDELKGV